MKKFKLIMSVATMCLALAVLCFGVFSATNITYTIGGSISYEVNDVFATVETDVYTSSFNNATNLKTEAEKFLTSDTVENATQTEYKYDFTTTGAESESYSNTTKMDGNTEGGIKIAYNTTNQRTYFVVISITNNGDNIISASITGTLGENANTTFVKTNPITSLSKSNKQKIVMAFMLDDITLGMSDVNFEYIVTINNGEWKQIYSNIQYLKNDETYSVNSTVPMTEDVFRIDTISGDNDHLVQDEDNGDLYVYNFKLIDIDTDAVNCVSIDINVEDGVKSSGVSIVNKNIKTYPEFMDVVMNGGAEYSGGETSATLTINCPSQSRTVSFCIAFETKANYIVEISSSKIVIDGQFKYISTNHRTGWLIAAATEDIEGALTIPTTFQNLPVVAIEPGAISVATNESLRGRHVNSFNGLKKITSVVIPTTITKIPDFSFTYCEKLESVTFHNELTYIGWAAFTQCTSLKSADLSNTKVTELGMWVFSECTSLQTAVLPKQITTVPEDCFVGCKSLTGQMVVPDGVTNIYMNAFGSTNLTSIVIPKSLVECGNFWLPASVTDIYYRGTEEEWAKIQLGGIFIDTSEVTIHYNYQG